MCTVSSSSLGSPFPSPSCLCPDLFSLGFSVSDFLLAMISSGSSSDFLLSTVSVLFVGWGAVFRFGIMRRSVCVCVRRVRRRAGRRSLSLYIMLVSRRVDVLSGMTFSSYAELRRWAHSLFAIAAAPFPPFIPNLIHTLPFALFNGYSQLFLFIIRRIPTIHC